jgi:hypothetical protein
LDFLTDKRRADPTLPTADLVEQCFGHFRLQELGTTLEDFHPHIAGLLDEVAHRLAPKPVKFAFGPEPDTRNPAAPKSQLLRQRSQPRQDSDHSNQDIKEFIEAYCPPPSADQRDRKGGAPPSLRSSSGRTDPFAAPHPAHTQLLGASLALEEDEDDEDGHEDLFFEEPRAHSSIPRVNILRLPLGARLYAAIGNKGHRGALAFVKDSCKDFPARTFNEMLALGAAADFLANGRPKDALEVIMRRFHGLNVASQSADPVKAWKAFETLQHPALSSSILPEDIELAMARALKRSANLFSARPSIHYSGASTGATASENGGGSKRG